MSTVFFNLVTLSYATSNPVEVRLYKTTSPNAVVASQQKPAPHPQHTWSFPGLDRVNYIVRIFDMAAIPFQIGQDFTVIPDNDVTLFFEPFWIEFGVTLNPDDGAPFPYNTNTFTVQAWIGRDIIADRKGADTQKDGLEYTWDKTTGTFTLLASGDQFQLGELWFLEFLPLVNQSSSVPSAYGRLWSSRKYISATTTLLPADISKKIVVKGASSYFEITLPLLSSTPEDIVTWFDSGRTSHDCVAFKCAGSDMIDWLGSTRTTLYAIPNESFELWAEIDPNTSAKKWRVQAAQGNFYNVGKFVSDYGGNGIMVPNIPATGGEYAVKSYARLYFEFVKKLTSPGQVCNYADWSTGVNKYKFSQSSDTVSEIDGTFRVPDLSNLFERNAGNSAAAVWEDFMMEDHQHFVPLGSLPNPPFGTKESTNRLLGQYNNTTNAGADRASRAINSTSGSFAKVGTETRPVNFRAIKRILI